MGKFAIPDTWRLDLGPKPDPVILASSLSIPHCFDDNGCQQGSEAAAHHMAKAMRMVRGHLIVLSAMYGTTHIGADIQAMVDAGIRAVHFSPGFAAFTALPRCCPRFGILGTS
jgi:hypothetical protein